MPEINELILESVNDWYVYRMIDLPGVNKHLIASIIKCIYVYVIRKCIYVYVIKTILWVIWYIDNILNFKHLIFRR